MTQDWMTAAQCRDEDPELFFPVAQPGTQPYTRQVAQAKAVCAVCPVVAQCREHSVVMIPDGVAGGLDEVERGDLRAARNRAGRRAIQPRTARRPSLEDGEHAKFGSRTERLTAAVTLVNSGVHPSVVAEGFGVSTRTIERWRAELRTTTLPAA